MPRRGRPPKFGRPSQLVAMTLPLDVVAWLKSLHSDPGWAIVSLHERYGPSTTRRGAASGEAQVPLVELAAIGRRQFLIVVDRRVFRSLPGIALVPLSGSRAFLALRPGCGLSDLEIAVVDRLDDVSDDTERRALNELRSRLREWRRDRTLRFQGRSIIVAEGSGLQRGRRDPAS